MELKESVQLGGIEFSIETGKSRQAGGRRGDGSLRRHDGAGRRGRVRSRARASIFSRSRSSIVNTATRPGAFPATTFDAKAARQKKRL